MTLINILLQTARPYFRFRPDHWTKCCPLAFSPSVYECAAQTDRLYSCATNPGGQAPRVALTLSPKLAILDEPTSVFDVSVQAQILNLLVDNKTELGLSILTVTHELAAARYLSDMLLVMRRGKRIDTKSNVMSGHPQMLTPCYLLSEPVR